MNRQQHLMALLLAGCGSSAEMAPADEMAVAERYMEFVDEEEDDWGAGAGRAPEPSAAPSPARPAPKRSRGRTGKDKALAEEALGEPAPEAIEGRDGAEPAPARAWFPETFLFAPQVVTNAQGQASVSVPVPDRLTTWRVLGLAHDQQGRTAGAVHAFDGRLPLSVEAIVPACLTAGDVVRLPVQVANTTGDAVDTTLEFSVVGAVLLESPSRLVVPAGGSATAWFSVHAEASGQAEVSVRLKSEAGGDAVQRSFPIEPRGRRIEQSRSGTLASARSLDVLGPADLDPGSARARLVVHPGALSVLRSEIATAGSRSGLAGTAYALTLGTQGGALLATLGLTPTTEGPAGPERSTGEALQRLRSRAGQRALRASRSAHLEVALRLAEPALADPDNEAVQRLGDRLARTLVQSQRPDGAYVLTGGRQTTQRMVVTTAAATEVVTRLAEAQGLEPEVAARRDREAALVRVRAAGVFERHGAAAQDAYSAAAMLASGALEGEAETAATQRLEAALEAQPDGSRVLPVPTGVVGVDGTPPSQAEATALAAIALKDRNPTLAADLGAAVLGAWRPDRGWGDGPADLRGLQAVLQLFTDALPTQVTITLARDGQEVARRTLQDAALRDLSVIDAPAGQADGPHTWTVTADPPVPGLAFAFTLASWVPWTDGVAPAGLELSLGIPADLRVGQPAILDLAAVAPAGDPLTLSVALPPGMSPDTRALDEMTLMGTLSAWTSDDTGLSLTAPPLHPGQPLQLAIPVVPTLAGRFQPAPATLTTPRSPDTPARTPATPWQVQPADGVASP